jgi:predicted transposase YdaD
LKIDPRIIILAPFTVPTDLPLSTLTAYGHQWKKTIDTAYSLTDLNDAINVMSLFFLNRFRNITREGIKAMLDFDILDTVAGRQVYDEGLEKGLEKGRDEGLKKGRDEGLKEGRLINMREMLALNLKNRFGNVSSDVMQSLSAIKDFEFLKTLFSESYSYDNYDLIKKRLATVVSGSDQTNYIK